jgi:predicted nucleic acid-binding protein
MSVFVDTAAWIALANSRDALHEAAKRIFDGLWEANSRLVTSEFVLVEVGNALSSSQFRKRTANFIENLRRSRSIDIVPATSALFDEDWNYLATVLTRTGDSLTVRVS